MEKIYCVYILASKPRGVMYVGVTSNLARRVAQHEAGVADGFTKKYGVKTLVYFEIFDNPLDAIQREKQLKRWRRPWKFRLIESMNPDWRELFPEIL